MSVTVPTNVEIDVVCVNCGGELEAVASIESIKVACCSCREPEPPKSDLRAQFTAAAITGLYAGRRSNLASQDFAVMAQFAVQIADAAIAELEKR